MSRVIGTRVIRGPDWMWGDQDGGESHLGTITEIIPNDPDNDNGDEAPRVVKVGWDVGKKGNYRVGYEQQYDLRMFDNSTVGVLHKFVRCIACASENIAGILWRCTVCIHCNLCTECYMSDSHELEHVFLRIDGPHDPGVIVKARKEGKAVTSQGIFVGAKVSRGPDWNAGKQDGGRKSVGTVTDICDWSECFKKCAASVQWKEGASFKYRVGQNGKVEIKAVEAAPGPDYYEDHLPLIGETETWKKGERVMVAMDTEMIKMFQEETSGNWDNSLIEKIGRCGAVQAVDHRGWIQIVYDDKTQWTMPPFALKKMVNYKEGDRVRISANIDMVQDLHHRNKRSSNDIEESKNAGQEGRVLEAKDESGNVKVKVKGQSLQYHHAALTLLPKPDGDDDDDEEEEIVESLGDKETEEEEEGKEETVMNEENKEEQHDDDDDGEKKRDEGYENIITNTPQVAAKPVPIPEPAGPEDKAAMHRLVEKIAEKLKEAGISESTTNGDKQIVKAAATGQLDKVKDLLRQNPKLANATYGAHTALQVACHEGFLPIVQLLVNAHSSLEQKDADGDTALSFAVIGNNPSVAEFLMERKAYVNTCNKRRRTPMHISAHKDHKSCVQALIKYGGSVNVQDNDGNLPIHLAIKQKSTSLVNLFIDHESADLRLRNNDGFTPLHYAAKRDCVEVVKLLVAKDPSLSNIQKDDGYTPLHVAAVNNHVDIVRILIEMPDCNLSTITSRRGNLFTPLHVATWQGYTEIVELLVDHGADVNAQDKDGDTVLHLTVKRRVSGKKFVQDTPTLQKVCEEIGDPAITTSRDALIALFIRHGSDVTIKNKHGMTPFDLLRGEPVLRSALMRVAGITQGNDEPFPEDEVKEPEDKEKKKKDRKTKKQEKRQGETDYDGVHLINPDELDLGKTVGRGGFGEVKKAIWRGTTVAVKIISTAGSKESEVEKEVSIHKRARHPNIVSLMAVGHQIGQSLIVMEFIDGLDLYHIIFVKKDTIVLTPQLKLAIAVGLLSALTFLHASNILHLDIKPSNIMVERASKRAYLCDLGLAHIKTRSSMSLSTSVRGPRGTITHMAPEMSQSESKAWACPGNDIWSIACTFLELFVECKLWEGQQFMALIRTLLKPDTVPPILKKAKSDVRAILTPCFERDPSKRPRAQNLLEQFKKLQETSS